MTYADIIRMVADLGADGIDLTTYWFADTNDETLFALKKLAYRSSVAIYTIGVRVRLAQPTAELQAAELETVRKWVDVAEKLGASHIRVFGGAVPEGRNGRPGGRLGRGDAQARRRRSRGGRASSSASRTMAASPPMPTARSRS